MQIEQVPLEKIVLPSFLHRTSLDAVALDELASSIRDVGLINPITLEQRDGLYILRAGHRRLEAHKLLGRDTIAAHIMPNASGGAGEVITAIENLDRANLTPMEEARVIWRMHHDHGITVDELARRLHRTEAWIERRLTLMALPDTLAEDVHAGRLPIGHACILLEVEDEQHREFLRCYAANGGATFETLREWVYQWKMARDAGHPENAPRPELPPPGQPVTVMMPCHCCGTPHPHMALRIVRICSTCEPALAGVAIPEAA